MRKTLLKKPVALFVAILMVVSCMTALLSFTSSAADGPQPADDVILISHVNGYPWSTYASEIIYGAGVRLDSVYDSAYQGCYVFEVQKIDGVLTVTKAFGPGTDKDKGMLAPADGFFLIVFKNEPISRASASSLTVGDTLTADFDYTVKVTSETPIGTLTVHKNYKGINLAAGIEPEVPANTAISSGHTDSAILTDGVFANEDNNTSKVGIYYNKYHAPGNGDLWEYQTFTFDLGGYKTIEGVRIQSFAKWGVFVSPEIRVYVSNDKDDWTLAHTFVPDGVGLATTIVSSRADFTAAGRYVKIEADFSDAGNMIGFGEIEIYGNKFVDGISNGIWQTLLEEGEEREETYSYAGYIDGDDVVVELNFNGPLSGTDASYGNGAGTNVRVWYYVPNAEIEGVACTTYTSFIDVSYTPSGVLDRLLHNTNPTGNTAAVAYGYNDAGKPYTVESAVNPDNDGMYVKITVPLSVLGATNAVEYLLTVSNKPEGKENNALYSHPYIKPFTEWKPEFADLLHPVYDVGFTQLSDFSYLRGSLADLTDGDIHDEYGGWGDGIQNALIFQNPDPVNENGLISLLYNNGEATYFSGVNMSFYRAYNVMIGKPEDVTVYASNDGVRFTKLGTFDVEDEGAEQSDAGVLTFDWTFAAVSAQFLRFDFNFSDDTWLYGDSPTGGKVFFEFVALTEVDFVEAPAVQPAELVALPEGAITLEYAGYKHAAFVSIVGGDGQNVAQITERGYGQPKDMNYAYNILVAANNVVIDTDYAVSTPCAFVVPAGGYIISYNYNRAGHDVMTDIKVGDVITLYNVLTSDLGTLIGSIPLTGAGFTYASPPAVQPETLVDLPDDAIAIEYAGYKHASFVSIIAGDGLTVAELTARGNNGIAKDLNYAYNILVRADNVVIATDFALSTPCTFVVPAGGYIISYNGNKAGYTVMADIAVGDLITLYNIDLSDFNDLYGTVELTDAGFTYVTPPLYEPGVTQVSDFAYLRGTEADLIDGDTHSEYGAWGAGITNALVFVNPTPAEADGTIVLVYNLDGTVFVNNFVVSLYRAYGVMIGAPAEIKLSYSNDAVNFVDLGTFEVDMEGVTTSTSGVIDLVCEFDYITAQYFKLEFNFGDDTWLYGDSPTDGKVFFEFVALTEIAPLYTQPVVQPAETTALPTGAIPIEYAGYKHAANISIVAGDGLNVAELTLRGYGAVKDMNYAYNILVDADGVVIDTDYALQVACDFVVPAGGYIISYNCNKAGYDAMTAIKVGDIVTLYNIDLSNFNDLFGTVELTGAGFTYATPQDERPPEPDISDYVTDGLAALYTAGYHSEDGLTWYDASGNEVDIDLSAIDGEKNYFDGEKGVFVNDATKVYFDSSIAALISSGKFTTEMVLKGTVVSGTSFGTYINATNDAYSLFVRRSTPLYAEFKCGSNDRPKVEISDINFFADSTVTITFDSEAGVCAMYVNGALLQSKTSTAAFSVADFFFGTGDATKAIYGEFVGFRFYDRALTAEEVEQNYAVDNPDYEPPVEPVEPDLSELWDVFTPGGFTDVDGENGKTQSGNPTALRFNFHPAYDDDFVYFALLIPGAPEGSAEVFGNGKGTNIRLWFRTNDEATLYTHFFDIAYDGSDTPVVIAKKNGSLTENLNAAEIDITGTVTYALADDGYWFVQIKIPFSVIEATDDFGYYVQVSNVSAGDALLYPVGIPEDLDPEDAKNFFPYKGWSNVTLAVPVEGGEEPSTTTEEPTTEEPTTEEPTTEPPVSEPATSDTEPPVTGDQGFVALAIISTLALAGVVVIKRKKSR
ncbi:MAG: LamG-like jellyroll fold domain-containing protein [Eubacteriales bacterium]